VRTASDHHHPSRKIDQPVGDRSIVVHGDIKGIASTGDYAFNVVHAEGGFAETLSVLELPLRTPPVLPAPTGPDPVGREELVERVLGQLTDGVARRRT
jgi:hypothetical protein